jgi:membrane-associated phospholipid phosphatase
LHVGVNIAWKNFLALDANWSDRLRLNPRQPIGWSGAVFLAHSGDSWLWAGGLGLVWLLDQGEWHSRAALLALAVVVQALVIFFIKQTIRRERPQGEWGEIYRNFDPHSFPSGHATRATLLAVMAMGLGPGWFGGLLLVWAPLVSLARVATGVHYLSDVLAGILIGLLMGLGMLALQNPIMSWLPFLF